MRLKNRKLLAVLLVLCAASAAEAVNKKITELDALASATTDDLVPIVDDPSGTAVTKKITVGNLLSGSYVPLSGGTMTGQLNFSGTGHSGLRLNSLTTTQRDLLTPGNGDLIYNSTADRMQGYFGSGWKEWVRRDGDTITGATTVDGSGIGATPTDRVSLANTTAAGAGSQQYSPAIRLTGQGWKTNATAASQATDWRIYNQPVQGAANPTSNLLFDFSVNGGAFGNRLSLSSTNPVTLTITGDANNTAQVTLTDGGGTCTVKHSNTDLIQQTGAYYSRTNGPAIRFGAQNSNATVIYFLLCDDATADVLAQRNGTNAQESRLYNTFTSSTNHERLRTKWASNVCYFGPEPGSGGGTARTLVVDGGASKALTEGADTVFLSIACPSTGSKAVGGKIHYTIVADDGSNYQCRSGSVNFSAVQNTGTQVVTVGVGTPADESVAVQSGTLTVTFSGVDQGANSSFDLRANATSSLTQTTLAIRYRVEIFGPQVTVSPQ